jgi:phage shock protein A
MSKTEHQQTTELGKAQSEAHHALAITSEATPLAENLVSELQRLAVQAQDGDPDLDQLTDELEQAETQFRELAAKAEYLRQNN